MLVVFLLALGLVLSLFNSSLIFEKTRRKNFKCLGGLPLPPLVKSSLTLSLSGCMESASVYVLVNDSLMEEFRLTRGLRKGDPLVPFLFIVVVGGLAGLVRQALKAKLLSHVKIGRNEVDVCMLQFADDTLFMCEDNYYNVVTIKAILRGYELALGVKINFYKSNLAGINVESSSLACFTKIFNCNQMRVPFKYLTWKWEIIQGEGFFGT